MTVVAVILKDGCNVSVGNRHSLIDVIANWFGVYLKEHQLYSDLISY